MATPISNQPKRTVYITGITGTIGRVLVQGLAGEYRLRGNSRSGKPLPDAEVVAGDINDIAFMREQLAGVDTLIHLAAEPSWFASWDSILPNNIIGTYSVYEAARLAGVRRILFASSNHVTGILTRQLQPMDETTPVRPDSIYGVSKVFGEALGRMYVDRYGISVLNFRIGWCNGETDPEKIVPYFAKHGRHHGKLIPDILMWLSVGDCVRAFRCGIEADPGLLYGTYYVMSKNRGSLWDMSNAERDLGWVPQDDLGALFDQYGEQYF